MRHSTTLLESEPGKGSMFTIRLPVDADVDEPIEPMETEEVDKGSGVEVQSRAN